MAGNRGFPYTVLSVTSAVPYFTLKNGRLQMTSQRLNVFWAGEVKRAVPQAIPQGITSHYNQRQKK